MQPKYDLMPKYAEDDEEPVCEHCNYTMDREDNYDEDGFNMWEYVCKNKECPSKVTLEQLDDKANEIWNKMEVLEALLRR